MAVQIAKALNYRKLFVKLVQRDEILEEALRGDLLPKETRAEVYLQAARKTAEISRLIDEATGNVETLSSSIQMGLASTLFEKGGSLKVDMSEFTAFRQEVQAKFKADIDELLDRIDRGEEEMIPFEEVKKIIKGEK